MDGEFHGEISVNLDAKGRLAIPTVFREPIDAACSKKMVITYNPYESHSLFLFPEHRWREVRDNVMALGSYDNTHRWMQRQLVGSAAPLEPDGNWRIQLPQQLRQVTELDKRVVFMGMGAKFELWNEAALAESRRKFMEEQNRKRTLEAEQNLEGTEQLRSLNL